MMHDFELHEFFHSPKNVHLKALHCKYLRSDYDQIAVIRRVSIPKYCHSQDQMIGSNFYYFSDCNNS